MLFLAIVLFFVFMFLILDYLVADIKENKAKELDQMMNLMFIELNMDPSTRAEDWRELLPIFEYADTLIRLNSKTIHLANRGERIREMLSEENLADPK